MGTGKRTVFYRNWFMQLWKPHSLLSATDKHADLKDFPGGSDNKGSRCNARNLGLIPGSGTSSGEGNGYPLQCSCLEIFMDIGSWQAIYSPCGHNESNITEQLIHTLIFKLPRSVR